MGRRDRRWGGIGWLGGMLGAGWALWRLGELSWLGVDWSDPAGWLASADIEVASAAIARVSGLVVVGWVAVSTAIYLMGCLAGVNPSRLDWLSIGPIRRAVDTMLAGSLLVSSLTPGPALAADTSSATSTPATMVMEPVDPAYVPIPAGDPPAEEPAQTSIPATAPRAEKPNRGTTPTVEPSENDPVTVEVKDGDHLWGLAEKHLAAVWDRSPTAIEVAPYWAEVIEANRDRLRSGDPDLIYPGEVVVLPECPPIKSGN